MLEFPVWDLFQQIGCLTLREEGLYWRYSAWVRTLRPGFLRLYVHSTCATRRLGLLSPEENGLGCAGLISRRDLGEMENVRVSIQEYYWMSLCSPLDGGIMPQGALFREMSDKRILIWDCEGPLSETVLPYFCFLRPEIVEERPCLSMVVDRQGRPVIPEISR